MNKNKKGEKNLIYVIHYTRTLHVLFKKLKLNGELDHHLL
jgi:hypothetical protein